MKPTHLLAATLFTALILACFAAPAAAFSGAGSGTEADPYIITSVTQWNEINNDLSAHYKLGNDISIGTTSLIIGAYETPFNGVIDGDGYSLSDISVSISTLYDAFYIVSSGTIKNIKFDNFYVTNTAPTDVRMSANLIYLVDGGVVNNCFFSGKCQLVEGIYGHQFTHIILTTSNNYINNIYIDYFEGLNGKQMTGTNIVTGSSPFRLDGSTISNVFVHDCVVSGYDASGLAITINNPLISNCVVFSASIDGMTNRNYRIATPYRTIDAPTLNNNYALSSIPYVGDIGTSTRNGADVNAATLATQSFYQNTLGWDFTNTWYWDDETNTPQLQVFRIYPPSITSITATPATGGQLTEYTLSAIATTEAEGGIASYQWSYSTDSGQTWQPISGATTATYVWTPGTSISGTVLLKCYITGADGGTVDSYEAGYTSIQITVVPLPEIDSVSVSRPLQKVNTPTTLTATFGDIQTGNTYQWYYSTNGGTTWQAISGATQPTAQYTPTTTGSHNIKIVVTTQYGDTTETATSITVLPTYTPTPITNTSVDISIDSTAKYQGMQQFSLSAELKALNYYTPTIAHLAHDNALYYLDSAEREVIPVSTTTGGTISAAYVGQNTGVITDTAGNTAFYSYQTNDWQYIEQHSASIIASTSSYAATVSGGTLRIYNLNGNLIASTATTAANLAGNDATNVFVSYNDKTLTYYWVNGNSISTASQTLTHSITELHQISGTNNFIVSTTANTIIVEITDAGVYSLVATSETDTPLIHTQATSINIFIGVSTPNEIFIIGADGETDGTYVTGSTLSDASIAKATGLYAIAGGADYQAYILSKSDSSVWQLQQVVSFGGAIDYSQISTTGTYAAVATGLKLYLLESKDTSSSVYYLQGVVIGSTGKPYAGKTITINGDSIRTDTKGMFLYPVQPGNLVTITAGDTTIEYTPSSAALQQIAIRIKAGLLSTDVTYSADYSAESQAIIMAYDDAAGKTTAVNWKVYETANNTLVATYTGNTASYPIEAGDVYNNYYVQLSADRGGATVTNTWSITPAGGQPIDLYGLDEDGRNIIFGFLLLLLAGLFGVMHSRSGAIIVALGACVMRYLELITIPWILITIAAVLAIVAAIAHGGQNR